MNYSVRSTHLCLGSEIMRIKTFEHWLTRRSEQTHDNWKDMSRAAGALDAVINIKTHFIRSLSVAVNKAMKKIDNNFRCCCLFISKIYHRITYTRARSLSFCSTCPKSRPSFDSLFSRKKVKSFTTRRMFTFEDHGFFARWLPPPHVYFLHRLCCCCCCCRCTSVVSFSVSNKIYI